MPREREDLVVSQHSLQLPQETQNPPPGPTSVSPTFQQYCGLWTKPLTHGPLVVTHSPPPHSPLIALTVLATWPGFNVLCTHNTAWPIVNAPSWLVQMSLCLQTSPTFSFPTQDRIRKSRGKAIKVNELPSSPFQAGMQRKYARFPQTHLLSQLWLVILQNINISLIQLQCILFT